jgi:peptide deformylase
LRYESRYVQQIDDRLKAAIRAMFDLMYEAKGIGLAANQVAIPLQFFVLNLTADPDQKDQEQVFINPEIIKRHSSDEFEEGCLSFPGVYAKIRRPRKIRMRAFDLTGTEVTVEADDLLARALQHEYDHLHGRLFTDLLELGPKSTIPGKILVIEQNFRDSQTRGEFPPDDEIRRQLDAWPEFGPIAD